MSASHKRAKGRAGSIRRMAKKIPVRKGSYGLTSIRDNRYTKPVDGQLVKAMRERQGLTKADAARQLGWPAQRWWDLEHERHPNPRIGTLLAVCAVLGCKVDDLLRK